MNQDSVPNRINNILDWVIKDKDKNNGFKYINTLLFSILKDCNVKNADELRKQWIKEWHAK